MTAFAENSTDNFWLNLINWSNEETNTPTRRWNLFQRWLLGEPTEPKAHPPSDMILHSIQTTVRDLQRVHNETGVLTDRTLELADIAYHKTQISSVAAQ